MEVNSDMQPKIDMSRNQGVLFLKGPLQLIISNSEFFRRVESLVEYGANIAQVVCGSKHTLFLTDDGEVLACGVGDYGLLGTGSSGSVPVPQRLEKFDEVDVVQIAAGESHNLALTANGAVYSWGRNDNGQLGFRDSTIGERDNKNVDDVN